jgi:2-methylcitrate dehydratase PrpD
MALSPTIQRTSAPTLGLAEFASRLRLGDVPAATVERVRACLLDTIGCVALGSRQECSRIVNEWVRRQGGVEQASLWTTDFRGPAASVALGIGTMAHAFDLDDYHNAKLHPSAPVIPAALAVAEARELSGERALAAIVAGCEVMIRVSLAAGPGPARMRGWHLTAVCGTLGAAAAVANLLDLSPAQTASALGLAGTQSAGLWAFTADGSQSKRFHPGRAAQSGILAAELAELGYEGPVQILEAQDGGLLAAISPSPDPARAVEGLGETFQAGRTAIKPYAACGSLHSSVDAVLDLARQHGLEPSQVERLVMRTSSVVLRQCGFDYQPLGVLQAQMSAQYVLAIALLEGACLVDQFEPDRLGDPAVLDLARRVEVVVDQEIEREYPGKFSTIVDFVLKDGRRLNTKVDAPRGSDARPLTAAEVRAKFEALAGPVWPADRREAIANQVARLETLGSARELSALLVS